MTFIMLVSGRRHCSACSPHIAGSMYGEIQVAFLFTYKMPAGTSTRSKSPSDSSDANKIPFGRKGVSSLLSSKSCELVLDWSRMSRPMRPSVEFMFTTTSFALHGIESKNSLSDEKFLRHNALLQPP